MGLRGHFFFFGKEKGVRGVCVAWPVLCLTVGWVRRMVLVRGVKAGHASKPCSVPVCLSDVHLSGNAASQRKKPMRQLV
jgi:hypothetical protein